MECLDCFDKEKKDKRGVHTEEQLTASEQNLEHTPPTESRIAPNLPISTSLIHPKAMSPLTPSYHYRYPVNLRPPTSQASSFRLDMHVRL